MIEEDSGRPLRAGSSSQATEPKVSALRVSPPDAVDYSTLLVKPWIVAVDGFGEHTHYTRSRGRALADSWQNSQVCCNWTFKEFLKAANAYKGVGHPQFGEPVTVCGKPGFIVSANRQYIQFVRPNSDVIYNSHPLDVEPPEARRMTPYYQPAQAIEAGTAETGTGSVHESAVHAPKDSPNNPRNERNG